MGEQMSEFIGNEKMTKMTERDFHSLLHH